MKSTFLAFRTERMTGEEKMKEEQQRREQS
jgi:hypothetical protein